MQTWKRILSCLAACCLTLSLLGGLTWLTQKKDSYAKHAEFFEDSADCDVFLVGSSRMMNGVFPMELWEHTGIASYNWAQAGHPPPAYYWVMRLALEYKQPKLAVIDCYGMHFDAKTTGVFALMHISMDSFPLSLLKIRAVRDLMDDPSMGEEFNEGERRSAFNLLWTFPVFHARWNQLTENDFMPQKNYTRGAIANNGLFPGEFVRDESLRGKAFETVGSEYLRRAIKECQSRGIDVLMTFIPLFADADQQAAAEYAGKIAEEYGVDYLNFFDLDVVNYRIDFADSAGHLNSAGARKITAFLGDYIREHYSLPDHRGEEAYSGWERDHAQYTADKGETLRGSEDLYQYLMLLERDSLDAVLFVKEPSFFQDPLIRELLGALGLETLPQNSDASVLLIRNGGQAAAFLSTLPEDGETVETAVGMVRISGNILQLDDVLSVPLPETDAPLSAVVLRNGAYVDQVQFHFGLDSVSGFLSLSDISHAALSSGE